MRYYFNQRLATTVSLPGIRYFTAVAISWLGFCLCLFLITHQEDRCFGQFSCEAVLSSQFSHLWGISLFYYGLAFYSLCFVIINLSVLRSGRALGHAFGLIARIITGLAFVFSAVLLGLQFFVLNKFCFYCITSCAFCALLFLLVALFRGPWTQRTAAPVAILLFVPLATLGGWLSGNSQTSDPVVYSIDGKSVHKSSLMPGLAVALQPFNDAVYETTRQFVEERIAAELVSSEAQRTGLDENAYLQRVIHDQLEPSDKEIEEGFLPDPPPVRGSALWYQAEQLLIQRRMFAARQTLGRSLEARHNVNILIERPPPAKIDVDYHYVFTDGPASAPARLVVLSDFECSYCATVAASMRRMRARFGDRLQIGFWNVPLTIHKHARMAAAGSVCAEKQGSFWQYHDKIFSLPSLRSQDIMGVASQLSLNIPTFKECLIDPRTAAVVEDSYETARKLGIDSTPSVFLNGELIGGVLPDEELADKILSILKERGVPERAPDGPGNPRTEGKLR